MENSPTLSEVYEKIELELIPIMQGKNLIKKVEAIGDYKKYATLYNLLIEDDKFGYDTQFRG